MWCGAASRCLPGRTPDSGGCSPCGVWWVRDRAGDWGLRVLFGLGCLAAQGGVPPKRFERSGLETHDEVCGASAEHRVKARTHLQQGAFARPIAADQPQTLPAPQLYIGAALRQSAPPAMAAACRPVQSERLRLRENRLLTLSTLTRTSLISGWPGLGGGGGCGRLAPKSPAAAGSGAGPQALVVQVRCGRPARSPGRPGL
jgi:hypothetical protein